MMRDFVDDGAGDLAADFERVVEFFEERFAENDDAIRQARILGGALSERRAFVQTKQRFVGRYAQFIQQRVARLVFDNDLDIGNERAQFRRDYGDTFFNQFLEFTRGHMIRSPAVAGQFYPADAGKVEAELDRVIKPVAQKRDAIAVVVPHAGWMYSGATAGVAFSSVNVPDHVIMIGPNHRGLGSPYALFDAGAWHTPVGDVPIDEPLAAALLDSCDLLAEDSRAHSTEHSLEVQVPMLYRVNPHVRIVPVLIGGGWPESGGRSKLREIGAALAQTVREYGQPVLLLASTDLNHYEDQESSRIKDKLALDAVVNLDEEALMDRVRDVDISMCGVAPTYIVIHAAKKLGAKKAELLDYRTSGDVSGDYSAVVGYGAVVIT